MCDIAKTCLKRKEKDNKKTRVGVFLLCQKTIGQTDGF